MQEFFHDFTVMNIASRTLLGNDSSLVFAVGDDREMPFAPSAAFTGAVLTHLPFAFTENFEARSVDGDDQRFIRSDIMPDINGELGHPARKSRVVGNREINMRHGKNRHERALNSTQRETKNRS